MAMDCGELFSVASLSPGPVPATPIYIHLLQKLRSYSFPSKEPAYTPTAFRRPLLFYRVINRIQRSVGCYAWCIWTAGPAPEWHDPRYIHPPTCQSPPSEPQLYVTGQYAHGICAAGLDPRWYDVSLIVLDPESPNRLHVARGRYLQYCTVSTPVPFPWSLFSLRSHHRDHRLQSYRSRNPRTTNLYTLRQCTAAPEQSRWPLSTTRASLCPHLCILYLQNEVQHLLVLSFILPYRFRPSPHPVSNHGDWSGHGIWNSGYVGCPRVMCLDPQRSIRL